MDDQPANSDDQRVQVLADAAVAFGVELAPPTRERLARMLAISDFVFDTLKRWPVALGTLDALIDDPRPPLARFTAHWPPDSQAEALRELRRFRRLECVRLVARDVLGLDPIAQTLATTSAVAEVVIEAALREAEQHVSARFGTPRDIHGSAQRLVVIGMGKLGGGELNFSSDVDLILAFAEDGESDGARPIDNQQWFVRLGQRLVGLLADPTADGFAYRTDLRLRPFGGVGRIALSFAAMEHYYQREGRDWERYAWIKARPVAGDLAAGRSLIRMLQPFVYRRYLDFNAIDGLRAMKGLVDAEVVRRELADDIKLGPGGIRELEFIVQVQQLTRGGREAALRTPSFIQALAESVAAGHLEAEPGRSYGADYGFLRRLENRLQMRADQQVHALPDAPEARERLARGLGWADWSALAASLHATRLRVSGSFAEVLRRGDDGTPDSAHAHSLARMVLDGDGHEPGAEGLVLGPRSSGALAQLRQAFASRSVDARLRARLTRLLPAMVDGARLASDPDLALTRMFDLMAAVSGRSTYLALLDERPQALARLLDVFGRSAFLAKRVIAHPLLLDDLLDGRHVAEPLSAEALKQAAATAAAKDDVDQALIGLVELRQSAQFRLGLNWLDRGATPVAIAAGLAQVADVIVDALVRLAARELARSHGALDPARAPCAGFAVVGYGSFGGVELGFTSDLDLVFVYDGALASVESAGPRPLEGTRWMMRLAQRLVQWLTTPTAAGRLYEVDTRLRPDGSGGLLVVSLDAFVEYQHQRAWTFEHQALVRARPVAGDATLGAAIAALRDAVLTQPRAPGWRDDLAKLRTRWRAEADRSDSARFDLKHGLGGLIDIDVLTQALVLGPGAPPQASWPTDTVALLQALAAAGRLDQPTAEGLIAAREALLARALDQTLNRTPRVVARDPTLERTLALVLATLERLLPEVLPGGAARAPLRPDTDP